MAYLIDPLHLEGEPFQKPIGYQTNERSRVDAQRIMGAWHQQVLISICESFLFFFLTLTVDLVAQSYCVAMLKFPR